MNNKMSKEAYVKNLTGESMPIQNEKKEKEEKNKKILCILGTAGSRNKAPWDDPRCDFWGVAHCLLLNDIPKMDRVFEIHLPYIYEKELSPFSGKPIIYHANKEYAIHGREGDIEVIVPKKDDNLNKTIVFPKEHLKQKYFDLLPPHDAFYATNSIAWMILWGIDLGYDEIHLYGIHLETDSEWQYERPCNEWWLGVFAGMQYAKGKKCCVYLPEESDVLRGYHEYGFADIEVRRKKILGKLQFFEKSINDMQNQRIMIVNELNKLVNEKNIPIGEKIKWINNQIGLLSQEKEKIEKINNEDEYAKILNKTIDEKIKKLENDLRNLDARINSFGGAKEQVLYFLKELNA
jgi:hypothetical protein